MKRMAFLFAALLLWTCAATAQEYVEGKDYVSIAPPQPTADPAKIEVIEFFWYGCPHCLNFEPFLKSWLDKIPKDVVFIRQPAVFHDLWAAHAKAFFTAQALGMSDKLHADFYEAIQNKKRALSTEADLAQFFAEHGVSEADFRKAYHSFAVDTQMRQAQALGPSYGLTGTPTLVINGKYRVQGENNKPIEVMNYLIDKERAGLQVKH